MLIRKGPHCYRVATIAIYVVILGAEISILYKEKVIKNLILPQYMVSRDRFALIKRICFTREFSP